MRSEEEAKRAVLLYSDTVKRICFLHLKDYADTEDIFQNVFMKYVLYSGVFENEDHERAWLIKVTVNCCKDLLKSFYKKKVLLTDYIEENALGVQSVEEEQESGHILRAVLSLPERYKDCIYLYYYEGYTAKEIGKLLNKNENTVYTNLARAKKMLKEKLGGELLE